MAINVCDEPISVTVIRGEVVLTGPYGIGLSMTARAAAESARRLEEAALKAGSTTDEDLADEFD